MKRTRVGNISLSMAASGENVAAIGTVSTTSASRISQGLPVSTSQKNGKAHASPATAPTK